MSSPLTPPRRGEDLEPVTGSSTPTSTATDRFVALTPEADERYVKAPATPGQDLPRARESTMEHREPITDEPILPVAAPDSVRPYGETRSYGRAATDPGVDHQSVLAREKEAFGGIKVGSAFFGWVAAAGIAVLLTSLLTAAGVVLSLTSNTSTADITQQASAATGTAKTVGLIGAILLLVVLFVAYYCGGYVAARMARFNGARQGLAVWLWGIVFALLIFILVRIAGSRYNILTNLNLPRIPVGEGTVTTAAIIAIAAIILVTLGAAVLGGLAGMRFHRNVDKAGLPV
jgi:hypothetical protein